jgi:hypothetical protein
MFSRALPSQGLPPVQSDYIDAIEAILASGANEAEVPLEQRVVYRTEADKAAEPPGPPPQAQGVAGPSEAEAAIAGRRSARVAQVADAKKAAYDADLRKQAEKEAATAKTTLTNAMFSRGVTRKQRKRLEVVSKKIDVLKSKAPAAFIKVMIGSPALNAIYRNASQSLFPLFMVPESAMKVAAGTGSLSFDEFFTKKLTAVCAKVWGETLTERIKAASRESDLRKFFEIGDAGAQCDAVIGPYNTVDGTTPCWICGVGVGKGKADKDILGYPECEHKLPVLWALLVSGLYDSKLVKVLNQQEQTSYKALLQREYAWAHSRCNQIKSHTVYLSAKINKTGGTGIATFAPNQVNIKADLETIIDKPYNTYRPTHTELLARTEKSRATWISERTAAISKVLTENFVTKLNTDKIPVGTIVSRFTTGLLDRAVLLAPDIVRDVLRTKAAVTPEQYAAFQRTFNRLGLAPQPGGRKRTYRTNQRGGISYRGRIQAMRMDEAVETNAAIVDVTIDMTKMLCLHALEMSILSAKEDAVVRGTWPISTELETEIQHAFIDGTDQLAVQVMEDILSRDTLPESVAVFTDELIKTIHQNAVRECTYQQGLGSQATHITAWLVHYTEPYAGFVTEMAGANSQAPDREEGTPPPQDEGAAPVPTSPRTPPPLDTSAAQSNGMLSPFALRPGETNRSARTEFGTPVAPGRGLGTERNVSFPSSTNTSNISVADSAAASSGAPSAAPSSALPSTVPPDSGVETPAAAPAEAPVGHSISGRQLEEALGDLSRGTASPVPRSLSAAPRGGALGPKPSWL